MTTRPGPLPLPLGDDGLLPPDAFAACVPASSHLVFAQQPDASIDVALWTRHATQFFDASLTLTRPKTYRASRPRTDAAHVVLTRRGRPATMHSVFLRPRTDADLEDAGRATGGGGLALLARRCPTVVLVGTDDPDGLFLAALLASVLLGPLLSPDRARILGARSARSEAEKLSS